MFRAAPIQAVRYDNGERSTKMMGILPKRLTVNAAWSSGSFAYVQATRLLNNIILARLLGPQILGLMVIVNTVRTGVELLSDVGINQNIISHPKGENTEFFDTAWSVQVVRGIALGAICFLLSGALAALFGQPQLAAVLPVAALMFLIQGVDSGAPAILVKRMQIRRISLFELGTATFSLVIHIAVALITPTIWALVLGSILSMLVGLIVSYVIIPGIKHRFHFDRDAFREIIKFGKWIFLSSIIYFAAMNFDRVYFAAELPLAALGVYGIARTLADASINLATKVCHMTLFPAVAEAKLEGIELRDKLLRGRRLVVAAAAVGLGVAVAVAGPVVDLFYDSRYQAATVLLPIMLFGVWFSLLCALNESVLVGLRRPAPQAIANLGKFTFMLVLAPIALVKGGLLVAVMVFSLSEIVRYAILWALGRKTHVAFGWDDLAATILLVITAWSGISLLEATGLPVTNFVPLLDQLESFS